MRKQKDATDTTEASVDRSNEIRKCRTCGCTLDLPTGAQLLEARKTLGLSRAKLASIAGVTAQALRSMERGMANSSPNVMRVLGISWGNNTARPLAAVAARETARALVKVDEMLNDLEKTKIALRRALGEFRDGK